MTLFVQRFRFLQLSNFVSFVALGGMLFSGGCTLSDLPPSESQSAEQNTEQSANQSNSIGESSDSSSNETSTEDLCESLKSSTNPASPGTWRVRNLAARPIWLRTKTCDMVPDFLLRKESLERPWYSFAASDCEPYLCEEFIDADDCGRGCDDCDVGRAIRIDPGDTFEQSWPGLIYEQVALIPECVDGSDKCNIDCLRTDPADPGSYDLSIVAYHSCEGDCECPAGLTSPCLLANSDAAKLDQPSTLETSFQYPDQIVVEVNSSK